MAEKPYLCVFVSDLHSGSTTGLIPAEGVTLDGGALWTPGPAGVQMWEYWLDAIQTLYNLKHEQDADVLLFLNGDLVDGRVFRDQAVVDLDLGTQVKIARQCLDPMVESLKPKKVFSTRGTGVHDGPLGNLGRAVARSLGAEIDPYTKSHAAYSWLVRVHQRLVLMTHHPPSRGRLVRTRQSQVALAANEVATRFMERKGEDGKPTPPPDLAIFSHGHEPDHSASPLPHRVGTKVIYLGAWQRKTQHAWKVAGSSVQEHHLSAVTIWPERWRSMMVQHLVYPSKLELQEVVA